MHVLGIDPGVATIGIGVIETTLSQNCKALSWLTIRTAAGLPLQDRLQEIQNDIASIFSEYQPTLVVLERLFFAKNERTALDVAHARGILLLEAGKYASYILEPSPPEWKLSITGDGSASKEQVQRMVTSQLHLTEIPRPDDAADALALALFGASQLPLLTCHTAPANASKGCTPLTKT